jgi:hypothetical protein
MRRVALALPLALSALLALGTGACKRKPASGKPCPAAGTVACADTARAFVCGGEAPPEAGAPAQPWTWSEVVCHGEGGCGRRGASDDCDDTVAADGEPCPPGFPVDYACTSDGARALACVGGKFALWRACRGPAGCHVVDGKNVECDTSLGRDGDPCGKAGAYACSDDGKTMLVCNGAKLSPASSCSGMLGCRIEHDGHRVDCDDSAAVEGEPCDQSRRITCSTDHKAELVCTDGHYAKKRDCRRTDCRLAGAELFCD